MSCIDIIVPDTVKTRTWIQLNTRQIMKTENNMSNISTEESSKEVLFEKYTEEIHEEYIWRIEGEMARREFYWANLFSKECGAGLSEGMV